jgi:hypothetical protein
VHGSCWHQEREGENGKMRLSWHYPSLSYDSLITPLVSIVDGDSLVLRVTQEWYPLDTGGMWHRIVMYDADNYQNDTILDSFPCNTSRYKIPLPWRGAKRVRFCWAHYGDSRNTLYWDVDDISVTRYPISDRDVMVQAIRQPKDTICAGATIAPSIVLRNCGNADEYCKVVFRIDEVYSDTQCTLVPVGVSKTVDFSPWVVAGGFLPG